MTSPPALRISGLVKSFARTGSWLDKLRGARPAASHLAVDHCDLEIQPGEIAGLVGESGSGKTTLGKCALRLLGIDAGRVEILGRDVFALPPAELRAARKDFQMVFQNPYSTLNPRMTVGAVLRETIRLHRPDVTDVEAETRGALAAVGLEGHARSYPGALSGGQRRRVGLARVFLTRPKLVVADEPVAGLDATLKRRVIDLMLALKGAETAYLFISHDLYVVGAISKFVAVMYRGRIVETFEAGAILRGGVLHPYTRMLLAAAQSLRFEAGGSGAPLPAVTTGAAATLDWSQGCAFRNRCPDASADGQLMARCTGEAPPLVTLGTNRAVACHLHIH